MFLSVFISSFLSFPLFIYVSIRTNLYLLQYVYIHLSVYICWKSSIVTNVLNCDIVVSEFELQSCYYAHFGANTLGKRHEPPYHPSYATNSTTGVFFMAFGIEYNKDTFCLYYFIKILSSFLIRVLISDWNWWMNLPKALGTILVNSSTNSNLKPRHLSGKLRGF